MLRPIGVFQISSERQFDANIIQQTFVNLWRGFLTQLPYIAIALVVIGIFVLIASVVRRIIREAGRRTPVDVTLAELMGRLAYFVVIVFGIFVAAVIVFPTFQPGDLIAGLGITSVAIGFAFKDVLQNFFAGILLLWRRPFVEGDQISFREFSGTVEEINVRSTRIKTYDGERAVIPNGDVYGNAVLVKTAYDKRRVRFNVGIGYTDSIDEARKMIHGVLNRIDGVHHDPGPWVYVNELAPSSVNFTVYFWTDSDQAKLLATSDRVATGIKLALDKAGIDMPYPHSVVFFHDQTGTLKADAAEERNGTSAAKSSGPRIS